MSEEIELQEEQAGDRRRPDKRIHFDGTVSAGNILTLIGVAITLVVAFVRSEDTNKFQDYRLDQQAEAIRQLSNNQTLQAKSQADLALSQARMSEALVYLTEKEKPLR